MKTIMILGGAGFIGSHLTDAYLRDGNVKVVTVDDLSSTPDLYNLQFARNHKINRHSFYLADTLDSSIMSKILNIESPDIIINCIIDNVIGNISLGFIKKEVPLYIIEELDKEFNYDAIPNIVKLKIGNVFGGREHIGFVRDACLNLLRNDKLLENENNNIYEWTYISDLTKAIQLIVSDGKDISYQISSGWSASYNHIGKLLGKIVGHQLQFDTETEARLPMDTTALRLLGWKPYRNLEDSLEATVAWYQINGWAFREDS